MSEYFGSDASWVDRVGFHVCDAVQFKLGGESLSEEDVHKLTVGVRREGIIVLLQLHVAGVKHLWLVSIAGDVHHSTIFRLFEMWHQVLRQQEVPKMIYS